MKFHQKLKKMLKNEILRKNRKIMKNHEKRVNFNKNDQN